MDLIEILQHSLSKYLEASSLKVIVAHRGHNPFANALSVHQGFNALNWSFNALNRSYNALN